MKKRKGKERPREVRFMFGGILRTGRPQKGSFLSGKRKGYVLVAEGRVVMEVPKHNIIDPVDI